MTSQGTPSTEVFSLISDVTEPDEISDDVNAYFQKLISPETGKTTYKCLFCEKTWETIVSTARKGHLANHQLAKLYSTTLCPMVPKTVSLHFIEMLNVLQQKKAEQKSYSVAMENRLNFEKLNTDVGTKRLRQAQITELIDHEAIALADRKVARYVFCTNHSFNSCEDMSYKEMISAVSKAGTSYVGPTEKMVRTRLLDQEYELVKARNEARINNHSLAGRLMTIVSDACTIHKKPLTNYVAKYTNEPGILLKYEDATELYQDDGIKDAQTVANGLTNVIEEVGERNVAAVVLDNAPVMVAAMGILSVIYKSIFFLGCLAHKVNTLVKHMVNDDDMEEIASLVRRTKLIVHHFNEKHKPQALLQKSLDEHLGTHLAFIIPAETRFGLYLLMLHRVYRMKAALQAVVMTKAHADSCDGDDDDEVVALVRDDTYWDELLKLLLLLMPLLRLIRLAELTGESIGKFYPLTLVTRQHLIDNQNILSYGGNILAKFEEKSTVGEWYHDIHLAAYALDPEYFDVPIFQKPDVITAFRGVISKLFTDKRPVPHGGFTALILEQLHTYKDKRGIFSQPDIQEAAKVTLPSKFWKNYGGSVPELQYLAKHIFSVALSNDSAEINWKNYKDCSTKERSRLLPETVHKLITIQQDSALQLQCYHDYKQELAKWTHEDELIKLDKDIQKSRDARVLKFKNYIEEWEMDRISLKNDKCCSSLLEKYLHMYLYDEGEVRRVVDVVWSTTSRPAKYQVVTQFIEVLNADDLINAEQENVNYLINVELHQCVKAARDIPNKPYNFEVELISEEEDQSD